MKRLVLALVVGAALALTARVVLAAEPVAHDGRVLISIQGNVTVPSGNQADVVMVIDGKADIRGDANTVVVIDGIANLVGSRIESVVAINSQVEVGPDTVVSREVMRLDSAVHVVGDSQIVGGITDLGTKLLEAGAILAPALFLLWLGFGLATIVAALLVAGLAGRQLREAARLLAGEPIQAFLIGLLAVIGLPILAILLMATVIGAPLGVGLLIGVMPVLAFAGYLVAATWIGGWIVRQTAARSEEAIERPFMPVVVGVLVLTAIGLVPVLGLVEAVASLLGFGAVVRYGYRTLRGAPRPITGMTRPIAAPTGA